MIADYSAFGGTGAAFKINVKAGDVKTLASGGAFAGPTDIAIGPGGIFADDPFAGAGGRARSFRSRPAARRWSPKPGRSPAVRCVSRSCPAESS